MRKPAILLAVIAVVGLAGLLTSCGGPTAPPPPPVPGSLDTSCDNCVRGLDLAPLTATNINCSWQGSHVFIHLVLASVIHRELTADITPRYLISGQPHGDSWGSDQKISVPANGTYAASIDAGAPSGVAKNTPISSCAPQIIGLDAPADAIQLLPKFHATDASVRQLFVEQLGPRASWDMTSTGYARVKRAGCLRRLGLCAITYVPDQWNVSSDEMFDALDPIWARLFTDPHLRAALIIAEGPIQTLGGKWQMSTYFTLTCHRSDSNQIDWNNVSAEGVKSICKYNQFVQFR